MVIDLRRVLGKTWKIHMGRRPFWGSVGSGRWGWVCLSVWGDLEKSEDLRREKSRRRSGGV